MSRIVFILGAGASKHAGAPLMNEFMDEADVLRRQDILSNEDKEVFERIFDARSKLKDVHSKAVLGISNIEDIFSAFEMGRLINRIPGIEEENIEDLVDSIKTFITITLEETVKYPVNKERQFFDPPEQYDRFSAIIRKLYKKTSERLCSIITFNYDNALDYALTTKNIMYDYYLSECSNQNRIPLLKLHGSLNWAQCRNCKKVIPWRIEDYINRINVYPDNSDSIVLRIGRHLKEMKADCCDNQQIENVPFIVPPTWSKTTFNDNSLRDVWIQAAKELSEAECIIVIGYSLPETDMYFRYLYALGSVGKSIIKKFRVYDIDTTGTVEERYRKILGQSALERFQMNPFSFTTAGQSLLNDVKEYIP